MLTIAPDADFAAAAVVVSAFFAGGCCAAAVAPANRQTARQYRAIRSIESSIQLSGGRRARVGAPRTLQTITKLTACGRSITPQKAIRRGPFEASPHTADCGALTDA
jgi:hypothetical protein